MGVRRTNPEQLQLFGEEPVAPAREGGRAQQAVQQPLFCEVRSHARTQNGRTVSVASHMRVATTVRRVRSGSD